MDDRDVVELGCARNEAVEQDGWGRSRAVQVHAVARSDDGRGLVR
jgi:hypothetical protein